MSVIVTDRHSYRITRREWTDQGYLKVPGQVARTGIQHYLARELELDDRKPDEVVTVYRPPEEVFDQESLQSYADVDVTNDHPPDLVDPDSFKKVAVGHTTDAARPEGDYVVADLIIKDKDAIEAVQSGKVSLSAGYKATYLREPGKTADGESYEFIQRDIRINHIALVDRARAGAEARLYDHRGGRKMNAKVTLDGQTIEVQDEPTAQLLQRTFDMSKKEMEDMEKKAKEHEDEAKNLREQLEQEKAAKDKAIEERDEAKKAASDEAIAERIKAVSDIRDKAQKIAGEKFTSDSMDVPTIQREALKVSRPTVDWNDQSDAYVQAAWDLEVENLNADPAKRSHDRLADDIKHLYDENGLPAGSKAYNDWLSGKTQQH